MECLLHSMAYVPHVSSTYGSHIPCVIYGSHICGLIGKDLTFPADFRRKKVLGTCKQATVSGWTDLKEAHTLHCSHSMNGRCHCVVGELQYTCNLVRWCIMECSELSQVSINLLHCYTLLAAQTAPRAFSVLCDLIHEWPKPSPPIEAFQFLVVFFHFTDFVTRLQLLAV